MKRLEGIDGLEGREPIGCAVTIGVKQKAKGFPVEKDRFHIVSPRDVDGVRPHLPQFAAFNQAAPEKRRILRGNLMHRTQAQAFERRLTMQSFPKGLPAPRSHPQMRPVCEGDGKIAVRWQKDDKGEDFSNIKCPHRLCEFRQMDPPMCKPFARFLFRLRWPDGNPLPTPLAKLTTRSWETTANLLGLFESLETAAKELGVERPTLYGFPFTMSLIERTKPSKRARYPVVVVSPDIDPVTFFLEQRKRLQELSGPSPLALPDMQETEVLVEDIRTVEVP